MESLYELASKDGRFVTLNEFIQKRFRETLKDLLRNYKFGNDYSNEQIVLINMLHDWTRALAADIYDPDDDQLHFEILHDEIMKEYNYLVVSEVLYGEIAD